MTDELKKIGFYTLEDQRAQYCSSTSPLWRCELILTNKCNFKCKYCRGLNSNNDITATDAVWTIELWARQQLKNIRFSGGEPTLWPDLVDLVRYARSLNINRIALSTNGSASPRLYQRLALAGVNDFSISLDSCCADTNNKMSGRNDVFRRIIANILMLSEISYVTVGIVLTEDNVAEIEDTILFASSLGVADIRIIPAAQVTNRLPHVNIPDEILAKHPILKYRINNIKQGRPVRGTTKENQSCPLVLDDMAVWNGKHYPCIIYLREQGQPIGEVGHEMRKERYNWWINHDPYKDPICRNNCLDVCVDYNTRVEEINCVL